ncbi:Vacuolar protein sorting-associated-like protein [Cyphellophora attinorum]|uniref:Vacuolar protein sorting-associated-like protein n=1 Tax=Cyphellophora attinorum TaxID=1664694 RepID=A0A0N1HTQ9_9EURO|nr:Vacuolar protein sorting-associated-like protein [Phialophora attinorum]KPI42514.1 Vacuolar protein sorting-associated-like protein [Phialophora attinorum]
MALEIEQGYVAAGTSQGGGEAELPIFNVQQVRMQFNIASDFVAGQVANDVLILALATGRILRIDLESPQDIDDVDLPKKTSEVGLIRRMFLDPSASHLIITTTLGENFYLHTQSKQPKALSRLKGVSIETVAWNPSQPTASTREILVGASDGTVYEVYIEPATEFYRREERYCTQVWKASKGAVTGLWVDTIAGKSDLRRVMASTHAAVYHWVGRTGSKGKEGAAAIYADMLQKESPATQNATNVSQTAPSSLSISPETTNSVAGEDVARSFGWLSSQGVLTGKLSSSPSDSDLGKRILSSAKLHARSVFPETVSARGGRKLIQDPIQSMVLTQWHCLALAEGRIVAVNRLNGEVVYDQVVLDPGQSSLGLVSDQKKNSYWLFTAQEIYEIRAEDEDRDVWKVMLQNQDYDAALRYAKGAAQKDSVATASGDYLSDKGQYLEAASIWGKSSKAFEEVCLQLIDKNQDDALRKYLLTKLSTYKKSSYMQRVMIGCWLVQIFMAKLNNLDDTIATKGELAEDTSATGAESELKRTRNEFQEFVSKHESDLDAKTVYEIISSHDREEELLHFANTITDYDYVLSYWIQRGKWNEALSVLNKESNPETYYRYSNVLMMHVASGYIEILMRRNNIEPQKILPALLSYNENAGDTPLNQNQAVRYLNFVVNNMPDSPASVHNTLISIMASHPTTSEASLLNYLETQPQPPLYDADFALRLCIQHKRVQSCVHIYSAMNQYQQAVELALAHDDVDLAAIVADRLDGDEKMRKKLWLLIAEKKVKESPSIKEAIEFLKRCELLKIEDLIPFFPDFVVIDDFKEEICNALEEYSQHIENLKQEMDVSQQTAEQIKAEIAALDNRYAIVEPGERCWICTLPVLSRQFFVFPCQHAFHSDCLGKRVLESSGIAKKKRIKDLQADVSQGLSVGRQRLKMVQELDGLVADSCVLCGDLGIRQIDEPFIKPGDNVAEWAI